MMSSTRIEDARCTTSPKRSNLRSHLNFSYIDTLCDNEQDGKVNVDSGNSVKWDKQESASFRDFFKVELTRGYLLEHDEERYTARRQKIYSFMRIPRDLERFMIYGITQCVDSFLYIHTFLPVRFVLAMCAVLTRPLASCLGLRRLGQRLLTPAEICDLLKCTIWIIVTLLMLSVDTNRVYHIIKSQSIIKLYIFYNMLEVGDRLLSAFGQDTIDALFWTATEPKNTKRKHFGLVPHITFALIYVMLHSFLIMFQATTLNVAVNSNNKGLLTIMISNNFVELKGSVFKKFDKNNLFQLTCSDVRERFHLSVLLFIVIIQTMKEFDWNFTQFCIMLPDCFAVFITEILIDWIKHAFITRFNELPEYIYREYTTSLAYDMTQTRQKHAFSDHSDLVARRMGFIPFPLGVVLIKAICSAVSFNNLAAWILFLLGFIFILGLRICLTICALGKACKLMKNHQEEKSNASTFHTTNLTAEKSNVGSIAEVTDCPIKLHSTNNTSLTINQIKPNILLESSVGADLTQSHFMFTRSKRDTSLKNPSNKLTNTFNSANDICSIPSKMGRSNLNMDVKSILELGSTALFSNSDVNLDDSCLNENVLKLTVSSPAPATTDEVLAHSEPSLQQTRCTCTTSTVNGCPIYPNKKLSPRRSHERSESEPSIRIEYSKDNSGKQ